MKKRTLALFLCLALVLSAFAGCGGGETEGGGEAVTGTGPDGRAYAAEQTYRTLYNGEVSTLNYLYSSSEVDLVCGVNCVEPLAVCDELGVLQPAAATEWSVSEDGKTWTFKVREGMKWYDYTGAEMGDVTAHDWVAAAKWVLDARNDSGNSYVITDYVEGAQEYYDYTTALLNGETPAEVSFDVVGIKAVGDYTLQFTTDVPRVYFPTMLEFGCWYPASQACLDEYGADFGTDNTRMWFCGPYLMDTFAPQESHVYVKNANYWDAENVFIERVERKYNAEAGTLSATMFLNGEIDSTDISSDLLTEWMANEDTAKMVAPTRITTNYSYFWGFNFEPMFDEEYEPDNWRIAVNNESFRKSIFHGMDRIRALQVQYPDNASEMVNNSITPNGFATNNGKDYTMYGDLAAFTTTDSYNEQKALEYKEKAIAELTEAGATFPIKILVQYNGDADWAKECLVIKQQLEGLLGTDYIEFVINNFGSQNFLSGTRRCGNYALQKLNGGADYTDPETWLFITDENNNYNFASPKIDRLGVNTKSEDTLAIIDEYFALVEAASQQTSDVDARYEAFANAEAYYLEHAMVIPYRATGGGYEATKLNPFEGTYSSCGWTYLRWKGQHVYDTAMSSEMYYAQLEDWMAARGQ